MTEAFLLSSASVGVERVVSGDGDDTWSLSIRGGGRGGRGDTGGKQEGRKYGEGEGAVDNLSLLDSTSTEFGFWARSPTAHLSHVYFP